MCYKAEFLQLEFKNLTSVLDLETKSEQFPIKCSIQMSAPTCWVLQFSPLKYEIIGKGEKKWGGL